MRITIKNNMNLKNTHIQMHYSNEIFVENAIHRNEITMQNYS